MKILQVNVVYRNGSTGKIMYDIHKGLQENGIESVVCYGRGGKEDQPNIYKTSSEILAKFNGLRARITGLQYNGSFIATNELINIIKKEKPDVVHLHCLNGYFVNIYRLIDYLKVNNINTVLTLHAEFMYTGGCGHALECTKWMNQNGCNNCPMLKEATESYFFDRTHTAWRKMKEVFSGFNNLVVVSVSPWLMDRAKQSITLSDKTHCTILNGIDTDNVFHPTEFNNLKKKHGLKNEKIVLHVTANFTNEFKGGKYVIELANRLKDKNIKIIVVGNIDKMRNLPSNIIDVGKISDQKRLAEYYSMADIAVVTSKKETFSMVCAESLACGTPVVGFKAGAPEEISLPEYSEFVNNGDIDALEQVIYKWIIKKEKIQKELINESNRFYSKNKMVEEYIKIFKGVRNGN